ncbi:MAG: DUF3667 domain-containing protein [Bacteroidales bacterium]|nr:DUF3667 domain-containing protein [Bacteroidales bacterium]
MSFKDRYSQFRKWQRQPFDYHDSHDHHGCCNCGAESDNNYCPRCGQKAAYGPITWHSVWQGVMDVWGVGTRSLPYTLWQLLWRPGYLIRDYISGKRQVSFPPVKMLVIMAVLIVLMYSLLGFGFEASFDDEESHNAVQGFLQGDFYNWMERHVEWAVLMVFSLFIVPVWFLFRSAPRLPRHTLPQGFFIQVFIGVQFLLYMMLVTLVFSMIPQISGSGDDVAGFMTVVALPLMLWCDYKQLFGYGWWGTLWRIIVAFLLALTVAKILIHFGGACYGLFVGDGSMGFRYLLGGSDHLVLMWLLLEVILLINTKPWREGVSWYKFLTRPMVAVAVLSLTTIACNLYGIENSIVNLTESMQEMFLP